MKRLVVGLLLLNFASAALAVDQLALDNRIGMLTVKFEAMQAKPDKRIPAGLLRQAQGIVLLDRTKAGFLFAYEGGSGVGMARGPGAGAWSAPVFVKANQVSVGFLAGGQKSFMVILLMTTNAVHRLASGSVRFGGEAAGTAGDVSGGTGTNFSSSEDGVLVFRDSQGLYGGAALKGGNVSPDTNADIIYYGQYLSADQIFFGHEAKPSIAAAHLARVIDQYSK